MRLLPGWLAAQDGNAFMLDGDASIRRRPVDRIREPLELMGARIEATDGRLPPFTVHGARLHSISYELPVASAQVKSCTMLAALAADGATTITEPAPSRDHTERMLLNAGVTVRRNGRHLTVINADELTLDEVAVPGRHELGRVRDRRRRARAQLAPAGRNVNVNHTRVGLRAHRSAHGRDRAGRARGGPGDELPATEPVEDLDVAAGPLVGHDRRGRRGPARDRRAAARGAAGLLRRRRDGGPRRAGAAAQGDRPDRRRSSRACAALAARSRPPRTASS